MNLKVIQILSAIAMVFGVVMTAFTSVNLIIDIVRMLISVSIFGWMMRLFSDWNIEITPE